MANCKICGAFVNANDTKCPFCGSAVMKEEPSKPNVSPQNINKVSYYNDSDIDSVFDKNNWEELYNKLFDNKNEKICIVITDTKYLENKKEFFKTFAEYIEFGKRRNYRYELLDLATQKVRNVTELNIDFMIDLLLDIYSVNLPHYMMIIGDDNVIPKMIWDNEVPDDDPTVPSDLPYISIEKENPWTGRTYLWDSYAPVGRIPASSQNNFNEAIIYMKNAMAFEPYSEYKGYALTAAVWAETSKNVFAGLADRVLRCPTYSIAPNERGDFGEVMLPSLDGYNLLGFNLHGSGEVNYWVGQEERRFPKAFSFNQLPNEDNGYVICVEACYGAKSKINLANKSSVLLNALQNKCIGFVGSTMIAYGQAGGGMSCADIIANVFLNNVADGYNLGDSFLKALEAVDNSSNNEASIKTLAEFALYGDPTLVFRDRIYNNNQKTFVVDQKAIRKTASMKLIPFNNSVGYYGRGNNAILNVSFSPQENQDIKLMANVIDKCSNEFINCNYKEFSDETPTMYRLYGTDEYRSVYKKSFGDVQEILYLHLDSKGNVKEVYNSK